MKTRSQIHPAKCILLCCLITFTSVIADKKVLPPDQSSLCGAWFGFDDDRLRFCRLELNRDGTGFFSTTLVDNPALLYFLRKWSLDGFDLKLEIRPLDANAEPIYLKGVAGEPELVLEMGGLEEKWKRGLRLFNERRFLAKSEQLKVRIESHKRKLVAP